MRWMHLAASFLVLLSPLAASAQNPKPGANPKPGFAPSISVAFEHEQKVWNAVQANDLESFNKLVDPPFTYIDKNGMAAWNLEDTAARLKGCSIAKLETADAQTQHPIEGMVILSYKLTIDQTCNGVKSPSPVNVLSVWQRHGTTWKLIAHSETPAPSK